MEREAIAYLCIDIHDFNEELKLEYGSMGNDVLQIAKERLNFSKQIKDLEKRLKLHNNEDALELLKQFNHMMCHIQKTLVEKGLDVKYIHGKYREGMNRLEYEVNILFDTISSKTRKTTNYTDNGGIEKEHDIFDDEYKYEYEETMGIELQEIKGRNRRNLLPPIVNAPDPKLSRWKKWRMKRNSESKKPQISSKSKYQVLE